MNGGYAIRSRILQIHKIIRNQNMFQMVKVDLTVTSMGFSIEFIGFLYQNNNPSSQTALHVLVSIFGITKNPINTFDQFHSKFCISDLILICILHSYIHPYDSVFQRTKISHFSHNNNVINIIGDA